MHEESSGISEPRAISCSSRKMICKIPTRFSVLSEIARITLRAESAAAAKIARLSFLFSRGIFEIARNSLSLCFVSVSHKPAVISSYSSMLWGTKIFTLFPGWELDRVFPAVSSNRLIGRDRTNRMRIGDFRSAYPFDLCQLFNRSFGRLVGRSQSVNPILRLYLCV